MNDGSNGFWGKDTSRLFGSEKYVRGLPAPGDETTTLDDWFSGWEAACDCVPGLRVAYVYEKFLCDLWAERGGAPRDGLALAQEAGEEVPPGMIVFLEGDEERESPGLLVERVGIFFAPHRHALPGRSKSSPANLSTRFQPERRLPPLSVAPHVPFRRHRAPRPSWLVYQKRQISFF